MYLNDFVNPESFPGRVRELPKKFVPLPDFSKIKRSGYSNSAPFHATVEQVVHSLLQRLTEGYERNRGGDPINVAQVKKWFGKNGEGFCAEVIGEVPFGEFHNKNNFVLFSHHHRLSLLLYLFWMAPDEMWNLIKKEMLSCRVYDGSKLTELYVKSDIGTKQSKDSYYRNPDMVVGKVLSSLTNKLSLPAKTMIHEKGGFLQPLASLLYACSVEYVNHIDGSKTYLKQSPASVYNCRQKVTKFTKMDCKNHPKEFPVSNDLITLLAHAIEDYMVFLDVMKQKIYEKKVHGDNVEVHEKIISQTGFFTFFVFDRMIFDKLPSAKTVAERLAYHCVGPLGEKINFLWNGDALTINERSAFIWETFRKSVPKEAK